MNNNDMSIVDHLEELRWRILNHRFDTLMSVLTFNFAIFCRYPIKPASQINSDLNLQVLTIQGMFFKMEFGYHWRNYFISSSYNSSSLEIFISRPL